MLLLQNRGILSVLCHLSDVYSVEVLKQIASVDGGFSTGQVFLHFDGASRETTGN